MDEVVVSVPVGNSTAGLVRAKVPDLWISGTSAVPRKDAFRSRPASRWERTTSTSAWGKSRFLAKEQS
jgi:hypothetical protein